MSITSSFGGHTFNNTFQYALLRVIAQKNGCKVYVPENIQQRLKNFFPDLLFDNCTFEKVSDFIEPHDQNFDPKILNITDNTCLNGFFQTHKYFEQAYSEMFLPPGAIKRWFNCDSLIDFDIENTCLIHFRGRDYVGGWNYLPLTYYTLAMTQIMQQQPGIQFKIITDDVPAATQHFAGSNIPIISTSDVADFKRLKSAKYLILSNSSYSWWAAYLNANLKLAIAPQRWFNYNKNYDKAGLGKTEANNNDWYPADIQNNIFTWI